MKELVILAGLATEQEAFMSRELGKLNAGTELRFLSVAKRRPKYRQNVISDFLTSLRNIVEKNKPERLRLLYMPYSSADTLVDCFFPFADIQSIFPGENFDCLWSEVKEETKGVSQISSIIKAGLIIKKKPGNNHVSLLPLKNFKTRRGQLGSLLKMCYVTGEVPETCLLAETGGTNPGDLRRDTRGLIFPACARPEGSMEWETSGATASHYIAGIYRFGRRWGAGFHHDVTHGHRKNLGGVTLTCSIHGERKCATETHANVYLNDFVRLNH